MTAPAQLSDYEAAVQQQSTLGYIAWYSLPDPHISEDDIKKHAKTAGVKEDHLPGAPRPSDSFKRAVRKTDLLKTKYYSLPGNENKLSYMVRPVVMRGNNLEAHLVMEVLDSSGKRLSHQDLVAFKWDNETNSFDIANLVDPMPFQAGVDNRSGYFVKTFKDGLTEVEPQAIRNTFRQELWDMDALNVRSRGGIYFIPEASKPAMSNLETFATLVGADFHTLPLPDTTKQKDMLMAAFENDVHGQAYETIEALDKVLTSGKKIPPSVWARHKKRFDDLTARTAQYSDLVDSELDKAGTELMVLRKKVMEVLEGDYIADGRSTKGDKT
jgi:hypothetical protein